MTINEIKEANQALKKKIQDAMVEHQKLTGCRAEVSVGWYALSNTYCTSDAIPVVDITVEIK